MREGEKESGEGAGGGEGGGEGGLQQQQRVEFVNNLVQPRRRAKFVPELSAPLLWCLFSICCCPTSKNKCCLINVIPSTDRERGPLRARTAVGDHNISLSLSLSLSLTHSLNHFNGPRARSAPRKATSPVSHRCSQSFIGSWMPVHP